MQKQRIYYVDICKIITIFIVAYGHVAQAITSQNVPDIHFFTGPISFHMPLFMFMSGFFVNLNKIRDTNLKETALSKFKHLLVPAFIWYIIKCILTMHLPHLNEAFTSYWFLTSLFLCYLCAAISIKLIKNIYAAFLISYLFILILPYTNFVNLNFMYPFFWFGYIYRSFNIKFSYLKFLFIGFLFSILQCYWKFDYSVYACPINFLSNKIPIYTMVLIAVFRLCIGLIGSVLFIMLFEKLEDYLFQNKYFLLLARYGKYTLGIYVIHLVLIDLLRNVLNLLQVSFMPLEFVSFFSTVLIMFLCLIIISFINKKSFFKRVLLGD